MTVQDFVYEVLGAFEALLTALLMPLKHLFPHYYFFRTPGLVDRETGALSGEPVGSTCCEMEPIPSFWIRDGQHMKEVADKPESARDIKSLIKAYDINVWECEKRTRLSMTSLLANSRKAYGPSPSRRELFPQGPIHSCAASGLATDGLQRVQRAEKLWIKGNDFSIHKLLGSAYDASDWEHATLIISRCFNYCFDPLATPQQQQDS